MSAQISKDCTRPLIISEDETKENKTWEVFYLLRTHHTVREIADLVGLNKSTVQDIKTKIDDYGSPLPHKQTGRPSKINERTERHLNRIFREDPFASYKEINVELAKLDVFANIETLQSYVDRLDFKSYRVAHKPRLAARHCKSRLRWAKEHLNWTEDQWRSVVWSDESRFCVEGSKLRKRVLRKEGERYDERNIIPTVKWGGGAMVLRCFWGGGFGPLEIIDTSSKETHQIKDFEHWPAQRPDLNPIEHVWNALERRIERKRLSIKNLEQLKVALREEWERMDDEFANPLVRSMKRRLPNISKWSTSHGYGEVKPVCHEANSFLLSNDLIRVAIFCKNALDSQNLEGILGLQIIGRSITFYLLVLPSEGLYVMYELGTLQLPNNLCDLRKLLMDMPLSLLVLDVFHRLCIRSVNPFQPSRHRLAVSESNFDGIFSTSQDRKRSCHLKKYN
ncbi:hypothetical protein G6F46_010624 [Rhizopus delemar]|uniref:Transposase Tc1-like domain-containing protein n=2 Tax=Rhizopus TaxID=4842 RepID=A0A9P7CKD5_9FUNG|nr:hypothetical protein G6F55_009855 [Rhizopus delemar]KAG1536926.1 hypothetical protein G6F51_010681 [Rhizopus arrhizus]KAG1504504.1 hypothetical protein G6F53_010384 [Rhizopus delemar]KAG1520297.1 hypothetical protein G6F52_007798 [Rhizopus delemar]KAG1554735.1 hypothetical protein G6F49_007765 [Rhizopus delemar]